MPKKKLTEAQKKAAEVARTTGGGRRRMVPLKDQTDMSLTKAREKLGLPYKETGPITLKKGEKSDATIINQRKLPKSSTPVHPRRKRRGG